MEFVLPFRERRRLQDRAYRAQQRNHLEVCGALSATKSGVLKLHFLKNQSKSPGHFEISSTDLIAIKRSLQNGRQRFVGTFHSHPLTYALPGPGDLKSARPRELMLVYDVCGCEARLWRIKLRQTWQTAVEARLKTLAKSGRRILPPTRPLKPRVLKIKRR